MQKITRTHFGIYAHIENDSKIMVIKKKRGPYAGRFDLPGGTPEPAETEVETLERELIEETGCVLVSYNDRHDVETFFSDYLEDDGKKGYFKHNGVIFKCVVSGAPNQAISDQDSNGSFWLEKKLLNIDNASPFLLVALGVLSHE